MVFGPKVKFNTYSVEEKRMKMTYGTDAKISDMGVGRLLITAVQQLLAIITATLVVPLIVGHDMSPAAALFGAGVGTLVYLLFTKFKSPVFLGSSFAFLGSMAAAFAGASTMALGYLGLIIGAIMAGLVYVVIALLVKAIGVAWIDKLMPAAVIGPTVTIIGLSLAGNAVGDLQSSGTGTGNVLICILIGLITLFVTMICSTYGKKTLRLIPFVIGIACGYIVALIFTLIGKGAGNEALQIINFQPFKDLLTDGHVAFSTFISVPKFTFLTAFGAFGELNGSYLVSIAAAYVPVAFIVFAEHLADHKNISSIIEKDLTKDPGLTRTLLGDGVGSMAGAFFGGCPNTTYGESIGCVAITKNAAVVTICATSFLAILISFLSPFVALVNTIPSCVMGGVCMALYGFIAVSGLKMVKKVDLDKNRNLFTVSVILIAGVGGLAITFGKGKLSITFTEIAVALILGILTNLALKRSREEGESAEVPEEEAKETAETVETVEEEEKKE